MANVLISLEEAFAIGNLLLIGQERAEREQQKRQRLVERLRSLTPDQLEALGIDPEDLA